MPAILVETAFIDNYDDNRFLASETENISAQRRYTKVLRLFGDRI